MPLARGGEARVVDDVGDDGAGEAVHLRGEVEEVDVRREGLLAHVHLENLQTTLARGQLHGDLAIETTRANQRLVQNVDAVRRGDAHHLAVASETVELHEELVQRLIAFVVARAARAARATDGV